MASTTLIHTEETLTGRIRQTITKCSLFQKDATLLVFPHRVQSPVSLSIFREFLSGLEGNGINITDTKFAELD
jgi:hypothetical protein